MAESFDGLIAGQPPGIRELAVQARALLLDVLPDADETVEGGDAGYGYGSGYAGLIFVLTPTAKGVRIGVYDGATLDDPAGLLQGRGKRHRHLVLASGQDVPAPALRDLLERAAKQRRTELGRDG